MRRAYIPPSNQAGQSPLWTTPPTPPTVQERRSAVAGFAADLCKLGPANHRYADGDLLFAHGHRRIQAATGRIAPH